MANCRKCDRSDSEVKFSSQGRICAECYASYMRNYYRSPKNRALVLVNSARARAKQYGVEFSLTKKWALDRLRSKKCEVTGIEFDLDAVNGPWGPSLDRIDPNKGYTQENTRFVVVIYNLAKHDFSDSDVLKLAERLIENRPLTP